MTEDEIITAVHVTPGNEDDGKQLKDLVNKTRDQQLTIEEVLADTAYSGKDNLSFLQKEEITASIPLNPAVYGTLVKKMYSNMTKKMMRLYVLPDIQV